MNLYFYFSVEKDNSSLTIVRLIKKLEMNVTKINNKQVDDILIIFFQF